MTASGASPSPSPVVRALLAHLVDYAGLFPPAGLAMSDAVANHAAYRESPDAWMLGRFVVPVTRLDELATEAMPFAGGRPTPWTLAALAGADLAADAARITAFNAAHAGRLLVDVVEVKASSPEVIQAAARSAPPGATLYLEIPIAHDPRPLVAAIARAGARAKVRTGGVTADAFPSAAQVARVIDRCARAGVPFKATAGLHHPLRGEHRLTYAADAPRGVMFGFLNLFAAAAFSHGGMDEPTVCRLLEERDSAALRFTHDSLRWREHAIAHDRLAETRASLAIAFGSCSFREPIDDLHQLGLL
jgi:hypothetical protein